MQKFSVISYQLSEQRGFTYLGLLFAIAIMGATLALTGVVWHTVQKREKEKELLFVGQQYCQAIAAYYNRTPGSAKQFPKSLEELLKDPRQLSTQRYLRKLYADPVTGNKEWGLVKTTEDRIMGVYSLSEGEPLKQGNFRETEKDFEAKAHYSDWHFVYKPPQPTAQAIPAPPPGQIGTFPGAGGQPAPNADIQPQPDNNQPVPDLPDTGEPPSGNKMCDILHRNDLGVCANMTAKYGEEAGQLCTSSAAVRFDQCVKKDGTGLPPLNVRFN